MAAKDRFSSFSVRDFRLFWIGQFISLSGTWMQSVAQGWLVYSLTQSPFYLGMVAAASSLPILLFTFAGGIVADRFPKRTLLLTTQVLSILPALLLGILTSLKVISVWQVAVIAAFLGTINALDIPVRQSFLAEMVGRGHVVNAIALNAAAFHGARMIGPVIAGILIAWLGVAACFYINALSFVAVIISLLKMEVRGGTLAKSEGIIRDFMKGIGFIREDREILRIILMITVFSLVGIPYITLLPVYAAEVFGEGAQAYGLLIGASGLGALIAAVGIALQEDIRDKTRFMAVAAMCFSVSLLLFSFSRVFSVSLLLVMISGWGMVSYLASANGYIQILVPDELRGRVMSLYSFVFLGTVPIGNAIIGTAADLFGTTRAVGVSGVICIGASVVFAIRYLKKAV